MNMKLGIAAFCLLCCCFEALHGIDRCSSCTASCTENDTQLSDEFPREIFTLNCPFPSTVKGFRMKLFKGQSYQEVCSVYIDNGKNNSKRTNEFCEPVLSDEKVSFTVSKLKSKDSDTYICCLEVLTPVYRCCKANEKHLYVQDSEASCWLSELTSWILIGLTVFFFLACIFSSISCCFRSKVCQRANTEYMAMAAVKPREKMQHPEIIPKVGSVEQWGQT
ncbi:inducible T-cell costimulator-like [Python bivittatus]|uniref:Inducible T-cell costimulator n=1 Tax=Python bivittatus TaxID=176946 RepID=A0A9F5IEV6_PYTBI|nr:inducible T-cell costimulator-like [Python bivittatus]